MNTLKNIVVMLFLWLVGLAIGSYSGWIVGSDFYNKYMVLSAYNSGYDTGFINGGIEAMRIMFKDQVEDTNYGIDYIKEIQRDRHGR